jgi:energy-coupling factor transporter ATP-binding protein EcfA2
MNDVSDIAFVGVPHRWPAFPYPGLRPFKEFEASIFYGRNKHKDAILERLSDSRTVFITGPSGCGKSSLVKAGVIPALGAGLLTQAGSRWRIAVMRPGRQPIENLATELASAFGVRAAKDTEVFTELGNAMEEDQSGLWGAVDLLEDQTTRSSRKQPVLLLVDQFEEIFGPQIRSPSEVDKFVHLVVTQYANPHPRLYLILTVDRITSAPVQVCQV